MIMIDSQLIQDSFCESSYFIFTFWHEQTNLLCVSQPYCSLHLHLHVSENPYTSGNIVSKESAPGIIIASGEEIIWFALWFPHPYCCLFSITSLSAPNQICSSSSQQGLSQLYSLQNEIKSIPRAHLFYDDDISFVLSEEMLRFQKKHTYSFACVTV